MDSPSERLGITGALCQVNPESNATGWHILFVEESSYEFAEPFIFLQSLYRRVLAEPGKFQNSIRHAIEKANLSKADQYS